MKLPIKTQDLVESPENLVFYTGINWQRICRIRSAGAEWYYENIDRSLMFSSHRSWVYAITVDGKIFKIGETGNPLGIEPNYAYDRFDEWQPKIGTQCRFGRYRKGGDSDETVRRQLILETENDDILVEFWAYPCEEIIEKRIVGGHEIEMKAQIHKSMEKQLINLYILLNGKYPPGNTGRY
jgi:hypothetical protein